MFSKCQQALSQFSDVFTEQKEAAMPKKKFAFARKAKKAKAAPSQPADQEEEVKSNSVD